MCACVCVCLYVCVCVCVCLCVCVFTHINVTAVALKGIKVGTERERERKKKRNVFNDALNTFYLWLHSVGYMVKNNSNSERGNLLPPLYGLFMYIYMSVGVFMYVSLCVLCWGVVKHSFIHSLCVCVCVCVYS